MSFHQSSGIPTSHSTSIETVPAVETYNKVRELVKEQGLLGNECDMPQETCIGFGDFAQYYIDNKMGRAINTEEALKLLDEAEEAGLVLSPTNSQDFAAICCCCSCCCPILKNTKMLPRSLSENERFFARSRRAKILTARIH